MPQNQSCGPRSHSDKPESHDRVWIIRGYDSAEQILKKEIPGDVEEQTVKEILSRLTFRDLTLEEIVERSISPEQGIPRVSKDLEHGHIMTTGNPHYIAKLIDRPDQ